MGVSINTRNMAMNKMISKLQPMQPKKMGGAGNKVNRIALNEIDAYCQPTAGRKFWDLCGPESIIRAMGGVTTNINGQRIKYDSSSSNSGFSLPAFYIGKTP